MYLCVWCSFVYGSGLVELLVVAVDGDTAVVRDGPGHGRHTSDDAGGGVITHDAVGRLATLPAPAQDEELPVAHRHATALLVGGWEESTHTITNTDYKEICIDAFLFLDLHLSFVRANFCLLTTRNKRDARVRERCERGRERERDLCVFTYSYFYIFHCESKLLFTA